MPTFGKKSLAQLDTCHPKLQNILWEMIHYTDFSVVCGHRNLKDQNAAYAQKRSQKPWPHGKHNSLPSLAVDIYPYPMPPDTAAGMRRHCWLSGYVKCVADKLNIPIRQGIDWDSDGDFGDQRLNDLCHHELAL